MCKVMQNKESVYETDLFTPFLEMLEKNTGLSYEDNKRRFRIIADHLRTSFMLINDGLTPSNLGAGYVLRMIIRRAYYNLFLLKKFSQSDLGLFVSKEKTLANGEKNLNDFLNKLEAQGEKVL